MQNSKILLLGILAGAVLALPSISRAAINKGIEGSPHDLSLTGVNGENSWNTRKGVCSPCHAAHGTDPNQIAPLWSHATTVASFTPYGSSTLNATVGQPDGASLACLSCHDGTVAINQMISGLTGTPAVYIDDGAKIGTDLHVTHPISFTYDSALAAADGGLEDPLAYHIGDAKSGLTINAAPVPASWAGTSLTGKTIDQALLTEHKMQCSSCHDVHKQEGSSPESGILARISGQDSTGRGSTLCRTCHIK